MEKVIELNNIYFSYGENILLKNINLSVDRGDYLGIVGPNGSGKSTIIKLLLKILDANSGTIKLLGKDIEKFNQWWKIGYISQKANSFNTSFPATIEEVVGANLFSTVGIFRSINKTHKEKIYNALETVGMEKSARKLIGDLSGGQQQKVFIARALVNNPDILLLDEPTVGIDAESEEAVYCLLARLNKKFGITIILVTHDISAITVHANKLACMSNGELFIHDVQEVSPETIKNLYGYTVNLHEHKFNCDSCSKRGILGC